jgi:hypothetical protein
MELKTLIDAEQLKADLQFSDVDMNSAFMAQASLFAHYAVISAQANKQVDDIKMMLEVKEALVSQKLRDEATAAGEKVVETKIASQLHTKKEIVELRKTLNEAKLIADLARSSLEAFRHKRDCMIQVGVAVREELKGEARVLMESADREGRREKARALATNSEA